MSAPANRRSALEDGPLIGLISETWAEILGFDTFGPDDDFFDLGGTSLNAATAVALLNQRLGLDLPVRALLAAPTPVELAELITAAWKPVPAAGVTPFHPEWVVPLQRGGTGRPVFVFPAGHHERVALAIEAQVAAHAARDRPFWGFGRDHPHLIAARDAGIAQLAACYAAQMRALQGRGPYLLYGNCLGGYLAWEAARQLLDWGESVAGILFYEVPLRPELAKPLAGVSPAYPSGRWDLSRFYRPSPLPIHLTHLMTRFWHEHGWGEPWRQVALGSYETVEIAGETLRTFERREERIAGYLREWIASAEARLPSP